MNDLPNGWNVQILQTTSGKFFLQADNGNVEILVTPMLVSQIRGRAVLPFSKYEFKDATCFVGTYTPKSWILRNDDLVYGGKATDTDTDTDTIILVLATTGIKNIGFIQNWSYFTLTTTISHEAWVKWFTLLEDLEKGLTNSSLDVELVDTSQVESALFIVEICSDESKSVDVYRT